MCVRNYPKNIENEAIVQNVVMKSPKTPYTPKYPKHEKFLHPSYPFIYGHSRMNE